MAITKQTLETKWGEFSDLTGFSTQPLQEGRFSVKLDDGQFECLFHQGSAQRLFVLLSGARDPATQPLLKFDRWTWHAMFPGSVLYISDPTLLLAPQDLHIGWYVGTAENDWTRAMARLVRSVAERLHVPSHRIVCYGSSAGGFGAMTLAAALGDATAVAVNPQTDVSKYSARFVQQFLDVAFNGRTLETLDAAERTRLSAIEALAGAPMANCLIVQNIQDAVHYRQHYTPLCKHFNVPLRGGPSRSGRIESLMFDSDTGHGPEPKELAPQLIRMALAMSDSRGAMPGQGAVQAGLDLASCRAEPRIRANQLYLLGTKGVPAKNKEGRYSFIPAGRAALKPYPLAFPFDWSSDPHKDTNWCGQLHMWRMLDAHLYQHGRTMDPEWLQFPLEVIVDWHRFHHVDRRESIFSWTDMTVGLRAMKLAYVISQLAHDGAAIDAALQTVLDDMVRHHLAYLACRRPVAYSKNTFIDLHGAAALAQVINERYRPGIEAFLDQVLGKLLGLQFNDRGVHLGTSPGLQPAAIAAIKRLRDCGWFSRSALDALVAKAEDVMRWFVMPDGRTIPFGDTDGRPQDGAVTATAFQGRGEILNSAGYVIVRDDGNGQVRNASLLAVTGASGSLVRTQADELSFVWFEGEDILCDAGKLASRADQRRSYVGSARAHNTVEIDGESDSGGRSARPDAGHGSARGAVVVNEWGYLLDAQVRRANGVRHSRFIAYSPNAWVLVIDRMKADALRDFTQWFHFAPHLADLSRHDDTYLTQLGNGRTLSICSAGNGTMSSVLEKGVATPRLQGWISQGDGALVANTALGYRQSGENVLFATLLCLDDDGSRLSLQAGNRLALEVSRNGRLDAYSLAIGEHSCRVRRLEAPAMLDK